MAAPTSTIVGRAHHDDNESDYGSDFSAGELGEIDQLLVQANSQIASPPLAILDVRDVPSASEAHRAIVPRSSLQRLRNVDADTDAGRGKEVVQPDKAVDDLGLSATITDVPSISVQHEYGYGYDYDDAALDAWVVAQDPGTAPYFEGRKPLTDS